VPPLEQHRRTVLPNGLTVVSEHIPATHSVAAGFWLARGSRDESLRENGISHDNGITHLVEHLSFKGTATRSARDIALSMESIGGHLDAFTTKEETCFYARALDEHLPRAVDIISDIVCRPNFSQRDLDRERKVVLEEIKGLEDAPDELVHDHFDQVIFDGHPLSYPIIGTAANCRSFRRDDILAWRRRAFVPSNMVVAVAGDFDRAVMMRKLNGTLGAWRPAEGGAVPPVPQPGSMAAPGVYLVHKSDVNQGRVSMGHLGTRRPVEDEMAILLGNDILGGGGFTSWITSRVRSDEGLAYSAGSRFQIGDFVPGAFRAFFQSRSATCARAAHITIELMNRLRDTEVGEKELATSKNSFIETFPRTFETRTRTAVRFALDEVTGLPRDHWKTYRDRVRAVDAAGVLKAARRHIHPDNLIILVVGNIEEILQGHPDHPEASFARFGPLNRVPLRDPMTLKPLAE